jgi:hypothetical protein
MAEGRSEYLLYRVSTDAYNSLRALDRPILSQPLTTILDLPNISLEAWISQTEVTLLRCISDANDDHVQTNTIDDYFLRRRDG